MLSYRPPIFVFCIVLLTLASGLHAALQNAITAKRFELLQRQASGDIVVVAIDPPSIERIGVWPWPRDIHARLIDRLNKAGTTDIALDIDFSTPSTPEADKAFEDALASAGGSVVLPVFKQRVVRSTDIRIFVTRPLPQFARHAWPAMVNVVPDADGIARRYLFGERLDGTLAPSIGGLLAGRHEEGSFLIDFGIRARSVPIVSYVDILREDPAALAAVAGRKVIVGATAVELGDRLNVPNGQIIPGALLNVLAAESILQGRDLKPSARATAILGVGIVFFVMTLSWRRLSAKRRLLVLFGLAVAAEGGAVLLQAFTPVVLDTVLVHAAVAGYAIALALDEIDFRGLKELIAQRRFQRIAMSLGDGLACLDHGGRITLWNRGATAIFGYVPEDMVGQPFDLLVADGRTASGSSCDVRNLPQDQLQSPGGWVTELVGVRRNGDKFPLEVCISAWSGADGLQYGVLMRDISVRKREEARIRYLASYDTLTGLPNRNTLLDHLDARIAAARTNRSEVALLMLDLDGFKDINDTLGHPSGDAVLREVASRLRTLTGERGLVARLGSDEFAIVIAAEEAYETADCLANEIASSFSERELGDAGVRLRVAFSIGVALFPLDSIDTEQLLADADLAMFRCKGEGAGRHVFFDRTFRGELERRLRMTSELELAFERGEFELFYQPQIRLVDRKVVGAEALIRWNHPERGLVPPGEFLPVLDTTPIANKVARWVMESACRQGSAWHRQGHQIRVGVNLSPSQFKAGDLATVTADVLRRTGFPASLLELEVTENILLADDVHAMDVFRDLRRLGVHLAWDDFGTGYASLTYLKKFPLNRLKIDQLFVRNIEPGSNDAAIVEYTINLARRLGLSVIAEGVETGATADLLASMGCEEAQGYHFGRPQPLRRFENAYLDAAGAAAVRAADAA